MYVIRRTYTPQGLSALSLCGSKHINIYNVDLIIIVMEVIILLIIFTILNFLWTAFWGAIPPVFVTYIMGRIMLKKSQRLVDVALAIREELPELMKGKGKGMVDEVVAYLGSQEFLDRVRDSANGAMGREVRKVKDQIISQHDLSGLPGPAVDVVAKGAAGYLKDYLGVPKKAAEAAIKSLFRKKQPAGQGNGDVLAIANELGIATNQPKMMEDYIIQ